MNKAFSAHYVLADLLVDLQVALQKSGLWDCEAPTEVALQSIEPFCIDTMTFEQWLRFVMIERFKKILASGGELPSRCHISPMAEEAFKMQPMTTIKNIVVCLDKIDKHLSRAL